MRNETEAMLHTTVVGLSTEWSRNVASVLPTSVEVHVRCCRNTSTLDIASCCIAPGLVVLDYELVADLSIDAMWDQLGEYCDGVSLILVGVPHNPLLQLELIRCGVAAFLVKGEPISRLPQLIEMALDGFVVLNAETVEHLIESIHTDDSEIRPLD